MEKVVDGTVKFEKITKKFGDIVALDDVSFEINSGDFVFITGPSGAGKTTINKLILRTFLPTSGMLNVGGVNLTKLPPRELINLRRKIGVVFQDFKLMNDRTVFENVALPLQIIHTKEDELVKEVKEVLDLVGLAERMKLFPAQLAGGELQRTCLARAIVSGPKIVLADEPTGNLDPTTAWQIIKLLKKINKLGTTIIMTTHNVDIVNSMQEKVLKIEKGKLVKIEDKGKYEAE